MWRPRFVPSATGLALEYTASCGRTNRRWTGKCQLQPRLGCENQPQQRLFGSSRETEGFFLSMSQNSEQGSCQEVSTGTKILQSVIAYEQQFGHQTSDWCFFLHKNPNRPFIHMKYTSDDYFNACSTPADHLMAVQSRTCRHSWPTHTHTHTHFNTFTSAAPDTWAFTRLRSTSASNVESNGFLFRPLSLSTAPTSDGSRAAAERDERGRRDESLMEWEMCGWVWEAERNDAPLSQAAGMRRVVLCGDCNPG